METMELVLLKIVLKECNKFLQVESLGYVILLRRIYKSC